MKNKISTLKVLAKSSVAVLSLLVLVPSAYALSTSVNTVTNVNVTGAANVTVDAKLTARITLGKSRADQEITRRISALNNLSAKINAMARVSADEKNTLSASIQSQISILTTLQSKIDADTDITSLKSDIQSITKAYRIFILVIPQGHIAAMGDSIDTGSSLFATLSGKLQTKITAAGTAGSDTSSLASLLADMNAKASDAKTQADAAVSLTANLQPDNGDQTIMKANQTAFTSARADLKVARTDLVTAQSDAHKIISGLKAFNASVTASSTSTVQ